MAVPHDTPVSPFPVPKVVSVHDDPRSSVTDTASVTELAPETPPAATHRESVMQAKDEAPAEPFVMVVATLQDAPPSSVVPTVCNPGATAKQVVGPVQASKPTSGGFVPLLATVQVGGASADAGDTVTMASASGSRTATANVRRRRVNPFAVPRPCRAPYRTIVAFRFPPSPHNVTWSISAGPA